MRKHQAGNAAGREDQTISCPVYLSYGSWVRWCGSQVLWMDRNVFVGRERELADLERRLVDSRTVGGAVVFCEGDAGMGKTALAAELARRARDQGWAVAWGACLEG
jgi:AAA ATPase domain